MSHRRDPVRYEPIHWYLLVGVATAAAAVIFFGNDSFYRDFTGYFAPPPTVREVSNGAARLTLDFGNGKRRAFAGTVESGMTILSALRAAEIAGRFSAFTDERGTLVEVAGIRNNAAGRWRVYRNNVAVGDLPGHTEIQPGDRIVLRYE